MKQFDTMPGKPSSVAGLVEGTRDAMKHILVGLMVIVSVCLVTAGTSNAATRKGPPPDIQFKISSKTMTDEQFLRNEAESGTPVVLDGELRLPNWKENLPVVILVHGSDGPTSGAAWAWRNLLDKQGVATFRLNYFTGRNIDSVEADQTRLGFLNAVYDVYRAVEVLASDPRIDPERIFVMGFSRGGTAALYAALARFHGYYGPKVGRIAAYLPFYAGCSFGLVGETELVDAPIRAFHGEADDWVPAQPCREFIDRARAAGHDAIRTTFPGVRHAFNNPHAVPGAAITEAQPARNCRRKEIDGVIVNTATGKPFSYRDSCIEMGPTVGYDKQAADAAAKKVGAFLAEISR
jgi:dienelactone hydrolase